MVQHLRDSSSPAKQQLLNATEDDPGFAASHRLAPEKLRVILMVAVTLVTARYITEGGFRLNDAAVHAMDGVLFLDMVREGGLWDPVNFGKQYYAHYPSIGFPYHYPPLFAMVEAFFFAFFGPSAVVGRLCVLCFHVASVVLLFEIVRRSGTQYSAFLAALFFATSPVVLFWSREVMLEAPAVCVMLLATLLLLRYDESPTTLRALAWAAALIAAVMTKQTTVFIIPAHGTYLLLRHGCRAAKRPELVVAAIVVAAVVAGYGTFSAIHSKFLMSSLGTRDSFTIWRILSRLLNYPGLLPSLLGWPLLLAALLGAWYFVVDSRIRSSLTIHVCWLVWFYLMTLGLSGAVERYGYFWVPPFAVLGGWGVTALFRLQRYRVGVYVVTAGLTGAAIVQGACSRPALVRGPEEAARFVATLEGGSSILVDSFRDGDFVFHSRVYDPEGRIILRGSKILYTYATFKSYGFTSFVESEQDILDLLRKYGVRYIVVDTPDTVSTHEGELLRRLLETDRFRRLARVRVNKEQVFWGDIEYLDIYEFPEGQRCTADHIELHFPGLSPSRVVVPLRKVTRRGQRD